MVSGDLVSDEQAKRLSYEFGTYVCVERPGLLESDSWKLSAVGWVGTIPLTPDLQIVLEPKVPIRNLFRMLEYAYDLQSFRLLDDLAQLATIEDLYERLATILAGRVLQRARQGFYREYVAESDHVQALRGRLDVDNLMREPWRVNRLCHYHEHTADVEENQLLAWTLHVILRGDVLSDRSRPLVQSAHRTLHHFTTLRTFSPKECIGRLYNRLNSDYEPLHGICRFFLEHTGPSHETGDGSMIPFLVDMGRLYELFVARWLEAHLQEVEHGSDFRLEAQERLRLNQEFDLEIAIDLVIYRHDEDKPHWVMDTKYKSPDRPSHEDFNQIVTYAIAKGCRSGVLIYPVDLDRPYRGRVGVSDVNVQTLRFGLDGDLHEHGVAFCRELLGPASQPNI